MEALIVALFALLAIVLIEAGYAIALALIQWTPVLAAATLMGWLAHRHGIEPLETIGVAIATSVLARHVVRACCRANIRSTSNTGPHTAPPHRRS
jgi:hypothetical protein